MSENLLFWLRVLGNTTPDESEIITKLSVVEKLLDTLQNAKENKVIELLTSSFKLRRRGLVDSACPAVELVPYSKDFVFHCLSSSRDINAYQRNVRQT